MIRFFKLINHLLQTSLLYIIVAFNPNDTQVFQRIRRNCDT